MEKKNEKGKLLKGGLLIVNPLQNYPTPKIYTTMINATLDDAICYDYESQYILELLRNKAINIPDFIDQYSHHNQLAWAQQWSDAYNNSCKRCKIQPARSSESYILYVSYEFCKSQDLQIKCTIMLQPDNGGKNCFGKVNYIDKHNKLIYFTLFDDHKDIPLQDQFYEVIILPSTLTFNSRCRTLDFIGISKAWGEYIFSNERKAILKHLIPIKDYELMERDFLQHDIRFSMNEEQMQSIFSIVSGFHGPAPYILFGPPGTGKTTTLVKAIQMLFDDNATRNMTNGLQKPIRVLVCTPSNVAADAFTLKLLETNAFQEESLLRVYSLSKKVDKQNQLLVKMVSCVCNDGPNGLEFGIPRKEELLEKKIILCTLNTSTYLINGGMKDCFTHIFIDEAGQADILETLIPIVGLCSPFCLSPNSIQKYSRTRVILAGDPKQLGPVQTCNLLKRYGNNGSLIEQLIEDEYEFKYDKRITTMLRDNYRSHVSIIRVPSILYYGDKLRACVLDNNIEESLSQWEHLPKKGFPLFWHSVEHTEQLEKNGYSYSNSVECDVVCRYVNILVASGVDPDDIGVITPYKLQGELLHNRLSKRYQTLLIDSCERFQGSERRVIIISTVRATGIGFMNDHKRFNTAITRAKELLIVVGSKRNMKCAAGWKDLIEFCEQNDAIVDDEFTIVQKRSNKKATFESDTNSSALVYRMDADDKLELDLYAIDLNEDDYEYDENLLEQSTSSDQLLPYELYIDQCSFNDSNCDCDIDVDDSYRDKLNALQTCMAKLSLPKT